MRALTIALVPSLLAAADPGAPKPITLKMAPLPAANCVFSPATPYKGFPGGQYPPALVTKAGTVITSATQIPLTEAGSQMTIGGTAFTVSWDKAGKAVNIAVEGAPKPLRLKSIGSSAYGPFQPEMLPLDAKRRALVAFPAITAAMTTRQPAMSLCFRSGAAARGTLEGSPIAFLDDDCSGTYATGTDAVALGTSVVFAPLAAQVATKKGTYLLSDLKEDGTGVAYAPVDGKAKLTIAWAGAGGAEGHVAIASDDGRTTATSNGKDVFLVPAGTYKVLYGVVFNPQKGTVCAWMVPSVPPATVAEDSAGTLAYGGPFTLDFKAEKAANGKFTISPATIRLIGKAGEEYKDFRWEGAPTVYVNGKNAGGMGFG